MLPGLPSPTIHQLNHQLPLPSLSLPCYYQFHGLSVQRLSSASSRNPTDWSISYVGSKSRGREVLFVIHSGLHFLWVSALYHLLALSWISPHLQPSDASLQQAVDILPYLSPLKEEAGFCPILLRTRENFPWSLQQPSRVQELGHLPIHKAFVDK